MTLLGYSPRRCGALVALVWLAGCSDGSGPACCDPPPPEGLIVSNPVASAALMAETGGALALAPGAADDVAYVSLAPGTVPAGSLARVRRVGDAALVTTAVTGGGFDPVPVIAQTGDSIVVVVTDAAGAVVLQQLVLVAAARRPIIVRTDPPPRKRDVPLNASLVIVFSEPMNASTLTSSSVQLRRGSTTVGGSVGLLPGTATSAVFTPAAPLDPNADYELTVTQAVRDLQGEPLAVADTVDFTTGSSTVGAVASVSLGLNDTATFVPVGSRFQLTATTRDAQGLEVVGQAVAWSSSNPLVVPVSPTGLVTAVAQGTGTITATVQGRSGRAPFVVTATLVHIASVTVTPESATVLVGGVLQLKAEAWDANGQLSLHRLVTWSSSNPAVATVTGAEGSAAVTGVAEGTTRIAATVEGKSDTAIIIVESPGPIAFTSDQDGCRNIYNMNADGSRVAALTDCSDGGGDHAAWSPDGQRIAFSSNGHLFVMDAGGSQRREVRPADARLVSLSYPAWSPDGMRLAAIGVFLAGTCGPPPPGTACRVIWLIVMNVDGSGLVYLGGGGFMGPGEPAWSPDGRIAYTWLTDRSPVQRDIYVRNADGSSTNLTSGPGVNDGPAWSPDGTKIAFRSNRSGSYNLYVMNADGSRVTQLTADSTAVGPPAWSPDGTMIAFGSLRDGNWEIYVMNADGSGGRRLTDNTSYDGEPAWRR